MPLKKSISTVLSQDFALFVYDVTGQVPVWIKRYAQLIIACSACHALLTGLNQPQFRKVVGWVHNGGNSTNFTGSPGQTYQIKTSD